MRRAIAVAFLFLPALAFGQGAFDQLKQSAVTVPAGGAEEMKGQGDARFSERGAKTSPSVQADDSKPLQKPSAVQDAGNGQPRQEASVPPQQNPNQPVIVIQNQNVNHNDNTANAEGGKKSKWSWLWSTLIGGGVGAAVGGAAGGGVGVGVGFLIGSLAGLVVALWNMKS